MHLIIAECLFIVKAKIIKVRYKLVEDKVGSFL